MRKWHAQALTLSGIAMFAIGMYLVYLIFEITRMVNSEPNPPSWWTIFTIPYCGETYCSITHTLAWNILAVMMSFGVVVAVTGQLLLNKITRRYV
ncbi:MAG: hypothetical protein L0287_06760 [Anaerolineae bacterium]|nr:hypothetical protein [Anaerolineae bacterium]